MPLPDLAGERHLAATSLYPAWEHPGRYLVAPHAIALADRGDGLPGLHLELRRALLPTPRSYGLLELTLRLDWPAQRTLEAALTGEPLATFEPLVPMAGWLRLALTDSVLSAPLRWDAFGGSTLRLMLDEGQAALLHQAVADGTMPVSALALMGVRGQAARAAAVARFDPAALWQALGAANGQPVRVSDLLARLTTGLTTLPIAVVPDDPRDPPPVEALRDALLDRLLARFATLAEPTDGDPVARIQVPDAPTGDLAWRLDDGMQGWRPLVIQWEPLAVVRDAIQRVGIEPFVARVEVPPLPGGMLPVALYGNLPPALVGVLALGADLHAPPVLPFRPQALNRSIELASPQGEGSVTLPFSPREEAQAELRPWLLLDDGELVAGTPRPLSGRSDSLTSDDFPLRFEPLAVEEGLLALATLEGVLRWTGGGRARERSLRLDDATPRVTLVLPRDAGEPTLHLTATARAGTPPIALAPLPADVGVITRWQVAGFGPHQIHLAATFAEGDPPLRIALESEVGDSGEVSLRPDRPDAWWGYVALDPFRSRFRYRLLPDGAWSLWLSPLEQDGIHLP